MAAAITFGLACGRAEPPRERPLVLVSVLPQRHFVARLAGASVDVEVMLPPGASPALYSPALSQLRALHEASLYVAVGHPAFPFEAAHLRGLRTERPELPVVEGCRGCDLLAGDPHYWLSPELAATMARNLARALAELLPERAEAVRRAEAALLGEIAEVDRELRARFSGRRGWRFYVFHPAWGYLADAYGIEQVAVEQDHKEPDPRTLTQLVVSAREAAATAVFVQPQIASRSAEVIAEEVGAELIVLDPLAEPWADNLREAGRLIAEHLVP